MGQTLLLPSSMALSVEVFELIKSQEAWEAKYNTVKDLLENISVREKIWETKVQQLEDKKKALEDKLDLAEKDRTPQAELWWRVSQLEQQIHQKDAEVLDFSEYKWSLSQKLSETRQKLSEKEKELVECKEIWEVKCRELDEESCRVLEEKDQFYKTKIKQMLDDNVDLQKNFNEELEANDKSWVSTARQMDKEKMLLEDICLDMKKKMRGFFSSRRTVDRETMLAKMKNKMLTRMEKEKEEQEEPERKKKGFLHWMFRKRKSDCESQLDEEAAGCSAQVEKQ
ncbi:golgin subfamily A member 6-like protein 1 [Sebastes umbrosus]|uniref:golgin subfamily A member 6-like protein 1 n=1 Tax=Sebastes umbrosus TaxID=72105 RepID=UPI00189ED4C2|nr:golgin subfamily A member 6-like protein 1 [Sebastes umbrosus]